MALVFKKTVLPGESRPLVIELPSYRMPGVKAAFLAMLDRAAIFVKKAGTVILLISVSLWALATYPHSDPPPAVEAMRAQAAQLAGSDVDQAGKLHQDADMLEARSALEHSFAGRLGHAIEPLIRPLGYDWQIGVGIISSFAAREVIVSTLSIIYGVGEDAEAGSDQLLDSMRKAKREDGSPVFTAATCASLLAFFVLAMQCLPTQAVTRRETGSWKWAALQLGYMTVLAYGVALITYQVTSFFV
jgi:ferrous iron transport protein B